MPNTRTQFWEQALTLLQQEPPSFDAIDVLLQAHDGGQSLIAAPSPSGVLDGVEHPVGGPPDEHDRGARGFLIPWQSEVWTEVHGHPPLMYMAVISGALLIDTFSRPDPEGPPVHRETITVRAGQAFHAAASNDRFDNFIHRLRCLEPTWSLHIYGDDPSLGLRFDSHGQVSESE